MFLHGSKSNLLADVNSENRLKVQAVTEDVQHHTNENYNKCFSIVSSVTPTGAGDCFLYLKNTGDKPVVITAFRLHCASDEEMIVKLGDTGTSSGGTDNTPGNRTAGSGETLDATVEAGADITGLSGGYSVDSIFVKGGDDSHKDEIISGLNIPKNQTLTLYATTGTAALTVTVSLYEEQ